MEGLVNISILLPVIICPVLNKNESVTFSTAICSWSRSTPVFGLLFPIGSHTMESNNTRHTSDVCFVTKHNAVHHSVSLLQHNDSPRGTERGHVIGAWQLHSTPSPRQCLWSDNRLLYAHITTGDNRLVIYCFTASWCFVTVVFFCGLFWGCVLIQFWILIGSILC